MKKVTHELNKLWILLLICLFTQYVNGQSLASLHAVRPSAQDDTQIAHKPLKEVLNELESKHAVYFIYESNVIDNKFVPVAHTSSVKLEESLTQLLQPLDLKFEKLKSNMYVIVAKANEHTYLEKIYRNVNTPLQANTSEESRPNVYSGILMKVNIMEAEQKMAINIKGKVTAQEDNTGLPGVNVLLKGTTTGTTTDANGDYTLSIPDASRQWYTGVFLYRIYLPGSTHWQPDYYQHLYGC
jgi:hypothetical protein